MSIFNGTPHEINFLSAAEYSAADRKFHCTDDTVVVRTVSSNRALSARFEDQMIPSSLDGIIIKERKVVACDDLPTSMEQIIICSMIYIQAAKQLGYDTTRLYTVGDPVYKDGKVVGCLSLIKA